MCTNLIKYQYQTAKSLNGPKNRTFVDFEVKYYLWPLDSPHYVKLGHNVPKPSELRSIVKHFLCSWCKTDGKISKNVIIARF